MTRTLPRLLLAPGVSVLLLWMIVPLSMTIYFSLVRYNLLYPGDHGFIGLLNYEFFFTDEGFYAAGINTLLLVGSILLFTVVMGLALAVLLEGACFGRGIVRVLLISPFFVMPTVNALVWKNMFMHPVYGIFALLGAPFGLEPVEWLSSLPLFSIILMISWQWTPFALLIFLTALQSFDQEQEQAARMDGANGWHIFRYLKLRHLARPIAIVVMIETIFHLSIFAEIAITTGGGPGYQSTNLAFLIYANALQGYDVGVASAGGLFAVLLANIVAIFLIRSIGKSLTED